MFGVLGVTRPRGGVEFTRPETQLVEILARQVAAALAMRAARLEVERLSLTEDQERIARDLHDTVIQRVFATAMSLQSTLRLIESGVARSRVNQAIDDLDDTIRGIRTTIFGLQPREAVERTVRQRVLEVADEASAALGFEPAVRFEGAVDALIGPEVLGELLPTVREALSNAGRHAGASEVVVTVRAGDGVRVSVVDNGVGFAGRPGRGSHGLANMADRAQSLGGTFSVESRPGEGTRLVWQVPSGRGEP